MKIVCQNCSANYKIPDDKVQGKKVFKIKCKRCGEDILVRGIEAPAATEAPIDRPADDEQTRIVNNEGTEPIWHAVLNGDQQGPFTVDQLRELMTQGQIDTETYVWRDGFEGWQPLRDVAELAPLITPAAPAPSPAAGGEDLFAPPPSATAEPRVSRNAEPAKARAAPKGGDLFAPEARSEEVSKSAFPSPEKPASGGEQQLTGQRNENSVLFSLATLQQLSDKNAKPTAPSTSDASGLIDINKLAGALSTSNGQKKSSVDDIMSVGATSGLASPLAAPVLAPVAVPALPTPATAVEPVKPQGVNKTILATGVAVAAILVGGVVGAAYLMSRSNAEQQQAQNTALNTVNPTPQANVAPVPAAPPAPAPPTPTNIPEASPAPSVSPPPSAHAGSPPEPRPRERERDRERERSASASSSNSANTATTPASAAARTTPPPPAPTAAPSRPSNSASIDDLLNRVAAPSRPAPSTASTPATSSSAGADLPETPDRTTVRNALQSLAGTVRACGTGSGGTAMVTIVFANTGRVTTATVGGIPPGPAVGCIVAAVRRATLPPFSRSTFSVTYPYPLN
jgi:predicted Zn finger-like uncharacterized protein